MNDELKIGLGSAFKALVLGSSPSRPTYYPARLDPLRPIRVWKTRKIQLLPVSRGAGWNLGSPASKWVPYMGTGKQVGTGIGNHG